MIRGLYTSATGMITLQKKLENVSNNLANIETGGFKKQVLIARAFDNVTISNRANSQDGRLSPIGTMQLGVMVDDIYTDFEQGLFKETNNPLDMAIDGVGFFTVQLPNGEYAYTRDGGFTLDEEGRLTAGNGYLVLDRNLNSITVGTEDFQVGSDGTIVLPDGQSVQLNIVTFQDLQALHRLGENMYAIAAGAPVPAGDYVVRQGFLEQSNVNPLDELVRMIEISRSFESNQKAIQSIDETLDKAVNEIGRL